VIINSKITLNYLQYTFRTASVRDTSDLEGNLSFLTVTSRSRFEFWNFCRFLSAPQRALFKKKKREKRHDTLAPQLSQPLTFLLSRGRVSVSQWNICGTGDIDRQDTRTDANWMPWRRIGFYVARDAGLPHFEHCPTASSSASVMPSTSPLKQMAQA